MTVMFIATEVCGFYK